MFYKTNFLKLLTYLALTLFATSIVPSELNAQKQQVHTQTTPKRSWNEVVKWARKNLPQQGKLIRKSDGYVYLKVDDNYIFQLLPKLGLKNKGYRAPPYFRSKEAPGAHISVFYAHEKILPSQLGKMFSFELKKIRIVSINPTTSYVILEIESKELETLRQAYGLSPKLFGHEFHISIGKKNKDSKPPFKPKGT